MAIDDIRQYIELHKNQYPLEVLIEQLRKAGHPENEIQTALQEVRKVSLLPSGGDSERADISWRETQPSPTSFWMEIRPALKIFGITLGILAGLVFIVYSVTPLIERKTMPGLVAPPETPELKPKRERDAQRYKDITNISLVLDAYYKTYHGEFPERLTDLIAPQSCGNQACYSVVPRDPLDDSLYYYVRCSPRSFHLGADLEDPNYIFQDRDVDRAPMCSGDISGSDSADCRGASNGRSCYDFVIEYKW